MKIISRGFSPGLGMLGLAVCLLGGAGIGCAQTDQAPTNTVPARVGGESVAPPVPAVADSTPSASPATLEQAAASPAPVSAVTNTPLVVATNVVIPATVPAQLNLSPALVEVVKLIQAGVSSDVVMTYVTNSTELFNIGSEEILYLHDLGTPPQLITALIQKDSSPEAQARRKAMGATQPLPTGVVLNTPATNVYPPTAAAAAVADPPEPTPVAPPTSVQTVAAPAGTEVVQQQPATVTYFESELAPYGSWVYVSGYGRCWRPTVAVWNTGWRPYVDGGRWLWTDSGWYWYSDYSWGWAPYHYGRWFCPPGYGWMWMPDVHWGPAWVSWRYSGSYCGWAPLPPSAHFVSGHGFYHNSISVGIGFEFGLSASDYVFLSYDRFCDRRPYAHHVHGHHAHAIYRDSKVANNYVVQNNRVINHGAGADRVPAIARGDVKRVALRGTSEYRDLSGRRRENLGPDGRTLTVVRPTGVSVEGAPGQSDSNVRPRVSRGGTAQSFSGGSGATSGSLGAVPTTPGASRPGSSTAGTSQNATRPREIPSRVDAPSGGRGGSGRGQGTPAAKPSGFAESETTTPTSPGAVGRYSVPQRRSEPGSGSVSGRRDPIIITGPKSTGTSPAVQPQAAGSSTISRPVKQPTVSSRPSGGSINVPQRIPQPTVQQPRREPSRMTPSVQQSPSMARPSFSAPAMPARPSYSPPARIESPRPAPAPAPSAPSVRSAPSRSAAPARVSPPANRGGGEGRGGGGGGGGGGNNGRSGGR